MSVWARFFGGGAKKVTRASIRQEESIEPSGTPDSGDPNKAELIDGVAAMMARQTAKASGTFETSGKNIQNILCSDNECPCTDQKVLVLGKNAYLYIHPGVVDFRKDCLSVLELEMKVSGLSSPVDIIAAVTNSMPKYLCETGARRRSLDLAVALADGVAAAQTGFVPLRPTPQSHNDDGTEAQRKEAEKALQMLVTDLLSSDRSTREGALVAARQMANTGVRRGVDALEIAIGRKAGVTSIELHTPGFAAIDGGDFARVRETLLEIAKRRAICKEAKRVGSLMAWLDVQSKDGVRVLLGDIRRVGGDEQEHEFQLVGTHLQAVAGYQRSGGTS